ncbi:unnamed protein product, partial [Mesorhabditis belari]|uniref:Carboxylesterase type B domain-containing protein n=1 Tax=Mesorhabditis belari TaxID=2138241 RepID=A0AAF3EVV9_9BILA
MRTSTRRWRSERGRVDLPKLATNRAIFCADIRSVNTGWGILRGEVVSPGTEDLPPVAQYLGVPYGVAPTGQYRFNMAISAAKWTNAAKDARQLGSVCTQAGLPELSVNKAFEYTSAQKFDYIHKLLPRLKQQSEDCLYLNLYVPERLEVTIKETLLPVLVIVHGDDYGWNSGNPYNGTILAAHGQIIVITLNYRLGVFGFLGRCESSSCQGNSGISDLVSALKMLSGILPAFGGDPRAVTLLGWGSGASLVSLLMASPLTQPSRRLFQRAILLDGTALAPWAITTNPQPFFMQLGEKLGCASKNASSQFNSGVEGIVRCMQEKPPEAVSKAAQKIEVPTFLSAFAPIVDGQLIPNRPKVSFSSEFGSLFREIDLLVGTTTHPAHQFLSNEDLKNGLSAEKREKIFRTLVRNLYDFHRSEIYASIVNEYTDWDNPQNNPKTIRNGVLGALSDVLYNAPLVETLRMHSSDDVRAQGKTFMFVFGHETRSWNSEQPNSGVRGSLSGDHIPYILGYPLMKGDKENRLYDGFSMEDKEEKFHSIAWPQFNQPNREAYLEITDRPRIKNYYRNAQVGFWTGLVPQLQHAGKEGAGIPNEHHLLPKHFAKETFFGRVRPYGPFANEPFPPPPMPPSPPPKDIKKPTTASFPETTPSSSAVPVTGAYYGTYLTYIIAIGTGMLLLNICVLIMICRQCDKTRNSKKKLQLQYQTYASNHHAPTGDMNFGLNSPEPLLSASHKQSASALRSGVSPSCPRHGRAAIALQGSRGNSVVSGGTGPPPLEEIQV